MGLLGLGGCAGPGLASVNLDAMHDDDGRHRLVAPLEDPTRYVIRRSFPYQLFGGRGPYKNPPAPKKVKNPPKRCLGALLHFDTDEELSPALQAARVRHCAALAIRDRYTLSRERAVLELGRAAVRLGLDEPLPLPEDPTDPGLLTEAVRGLIEVATRLMQQKDPPSATDRADLEAACELVLGMPLDLEAGRRVLKTIELLELPGRAADDSGGPGGAADPFAPLYDLSEDVQRQLVAQGLSAGRRDEHPRVHAAGLRANFQAYGDAFLLFELLRLESALDQNQPVPYREEAFVELLRLVAEHGIPQAKDVNAFQQQELRMRVLFTLVRVAMSFSAFENPVRSMAMRALGAVSGAGFQSQLFEDWTEWWTEYGAQYLERMNPLVPAPPPEETDTP